MKNKIFSFFRLSVFRRYDIKHRYELTKAEIEKLVEQTPGEVTEAFCESLESYARDRIKEQFETYQLLVSRAFRYAQISIALIVAIAAVSRVQTFEHAIGTPTYIALSVLAVSLLFVLQCTQTQKYYKPPSMIAFADLYVARIRDYKQPPAAASVTTRYIMAMRIQRGLDGNETVHGWIADCLWWAQNCIVAGLGLVVYDLVSKT